MSSLYKSYFFPNWDILIALFDYSLDIVLSVVYRQISLIHVSIFHEFHNEIVWEFLTLGIIQIKNFVTELMHAN